MITIKSATEIDKMKRAGEVVAIAHEKIRESICPGITTSDLNKIAEEVIRKHGAIPSFLGFPNVYGAIDFPGCICSSVNEEVVHGLPGNRTLEEGDIISIDIGALLDGYHGDAARTWPVGKVTEIAEKLIEATKQSFFDGMKMAVEGNRIVDISRAVQNTVEKNGFSVVREYVGHGIGTEMHEPPQIPNYVTRERGPRLQTGMTIAVEPMVNEGTYKVNLLDNKWTVVTQDGKLSAHYENTIAIIKDTPIVLTCI